MQATTIAELGLAALGLVLLLTGAPPITTEARVELRTEHLGRDGLRSLETDATAGVESVFERIIHLGRVHRADLERIRLAPDPGALRTRVRQSVPDRVLDPDAISVRALRPPRLGRPLRIEVGITGALVGDRVVLAGDPDLPLAGSLVAARLRAEHELPELRPLLRNTVRWAGRRAGRDGLVEASFELRAGAEPRFWLGEGLRAEGSVDRVLRLQGFRRVDDPSTADLLVLGLCRKAPDSLGRLLDRGAGCLLVAEPGLGMHPSMLAFAPVMPARAGPLASSSSPDDGRSAGPAGEVGSSGRPGPATGGKPGGLSRPGAVSEAEKSEALRKGGKKGARSVALVLVVDNSGSMRDHSRIEMAKKGAWATASKLGRGDQLALISFGSRARLLLRLGPANDPLHRGRLRAALEGLDASGSATNCFPALEKAWAELERAEGRDPIRHVVVLTDGEFTDLMKDYQGVLRGMTGRGIGITGLGIYQEESRFGATQFVFLDKILAGVGGHMVLTKHATEVPELLLGEVELISGARSLEEGGEGGKATETAPKGPGTTEGGSEAASRSDAGAVHRFGLRVVDAEPVLEGLEEVAWPSVAGYLPLEAQIRTRVHLAVGEGGHVFLATSPFGLGRVGVLAGSDGAPWCGELTSRPWYPRLLAQLAAWLLPSGEPAAEGGQRTFRRVRSRVLEGDGVEPGVPALVARLVGGTVEKLPSPRIGSIRIRHAGPVWPWLSALLLGFLGVLVLEKVRSRV